MTASNDKISTPASNQMSMSIAQLSPFFKKYQSWLTRKVLCPFLSYSLLIDIVIHEGLTKWVYQTYSMMAITPTWKG